MAKGPYFGLQDFFGVPLIEKAEELGYSLDNLLILKGKMDTLREKYPDIYNNIYSCNHNRDRRSPEQYAKDLVASWLFEDYIVNMIDNQDFSVSLDGSDKERHILAKTNVKSDSDFVISKNGLSVKLELATDYYNYWSTFGCIDLRDDKFNKLKTSGSLLLGVSILDRSFFLLDFRDDSVKASFIPHHKPYGFKPAYRINFQETNAHFFEFSKANMIKEILRLL